SHSPPKAYEINIVPGQPIAREVGWARRRWMSALGQKPTYAAQQAMSALHPKADICSVKRHVRFGPETDINEKAGCAPTGGERDGSGCAFVPRIQRRSTGWDCRSHDCPPKYCLCGSSLRTSDTGSPNTHYLCLPRSPRTMGPRKPELAVNQQSRQQE